MKTIKLGSMSVTGNAHFISEDNQDITYRLPKEKGGILIPELVGCKEQYFTFFAESLTDHSVALKLCFYTTNPDEPSFFITFGLLPQVRALICMDMEWIKGERVFPERNPGQIKLVCLGEHINAADVTKVTIENSPCFTEIDLVISEPCLTDERPSEFPIPDVKLIDKFGQYKLKEWSNKIKDEETLKKRILALAGKEGSEAVFPFPDWNERYGSYKKMKLTEGTGYFSKIKQDGRWWLTDPDGFAFFSVGIDVIVPQIDCRTDGVEKWMDWLPEQDDPVYKEFYNFDISSHDKVTPYTSFAYEKVNLYRAFGNDWYERWLDFMPRFLKNCGVNTIGNWSDFTLSERSGMPYVYWNRNFPTTKTLIFRDFPDVLNPEYRENAVVCAGELKERANDPDMIGYFLRNEPHWAFADNLIIADEVLGCGLQTYCRDELIKRLKEKYQTAGALGAAWGIEIASFNDLCTCFTDGAQKPSSLNDASNEDMREFSRFLLNEYAMVPSEECRKVDPNHMNMGMRWAWIKDPDIVSGWQNFDVFSINCYQADAVPTMNSATDAGVDLPIIVGEFQFGALDMGPTATGLFGVLTQKGRARAYRYYSEQLAAHPNGVGHHYFQCYDQFALGRFDGENYNIGFLDLCSQPYEEFINDGVKKSSEIIYDVMQGKIPAYNETDIDYIPMIAY